MRKFAFRRTAVVGAIWVGLLGVLATVSPSASGQEAVEPGKGNAYAQGVKFDPRTGQLSVGVAYGEALAGHQNNQALAEARSLNLGIIGTLLAAEGCSGGDPTLPKEQQPQPLVARTDDGGKKTKSSSELGVQRDVSVANDPIAVARATAAGGGQPGALSIGAATTETTSGVIDGRRLARAVTHIDDINIGGVVKLSGLKWVAEYQTEPEEATVTDFSIEGISVAENPLLPLGELTPTVFDTLGQANAALELLGIRITPPKSFVAQGIAFVDPLRISVVPNPERDGAIGMLFDALQPLREALFGAALDISCSFGSLITVADIVAGSVSGAGSLNIELGGVTATSSDINIFEFPDFGAPGPLPGPLVSAPLPLPPAAPSLGTPSSGLPTTVDTGQSGADSSGNEEVAAPVSEKRPLSGVRGGPLMYTGLAGLLLLGALAEADRRKMRKAQRSGPIISGA